MICLGHHDAAFGIASVPIQPDAKRLAVDGVT